MTEDLGAAETGYEADRNATKTLNHFLLAGWGVLLIATIVGLLFFIPILPIPIIGMIALPFAPLPTLLPYVTLALCLYAAAQLALSLIRGRQLPLAGALLLLFGCAGISILAGFVAANRLNAELTAQTAENAARVAGKPLGLKQVGRVVLVEPSDRYGLRDTCDGFCKSVLLSGTAREVVVATSLPRSAGAAGSLKGMRYFRKQAPSECARQSERPLTSPDDPNFDRALEDRYGTCLGGSVIELSENEAEASDWYLHKSWKRERGGSFLGFGLPRSTGDSAFEYRILRSGKPVLRHVAAPDFRLAAPLYVNVFTGNAATGSSAPVWGSVALAQENKSELPGWWRFVSDPDDLLKKALSGD